MNMFACHCVCVFAGDFYGVWIPVDEDTCLPVSESFTNRADKSFHTRRCAAFQ